MSEPPPGCARPVGPKGANHTALVLQKQPDTGEIRDDQADALLAEGYVRVGCVDSATWAPRDLPDDVLRLVSGLADLAARQSRGAVEMPWT